MTRKNWLELILIVLVGGILGAWVSSLHQSNAIVIDKHGIRKQTCMASSFDPSSKACFDNPSQPRRKSAKNK
jgi:hypothetical protein